MRRVALVLLLCSCSNDAGSSAITAADNSSDSGDSDADNSTTSSTGTTNQPVSTATMTVSTTADPGACNDTHACVPGAPPQWTGPVFLYTGDAGTLPGCAANVPDVALAANLELADPGDFACECDCSGLDDVDCGNGMMSSGADIDSCTDAFSLSADECVNAQPDPWPALAASLTANSVGASCSPVVTVSPPPMWLSDALACQGAFEATDECSPGEVCAELPSDGPSASACIFRAGDVNCPNTPYLTRVRVFTELDEEAACSACECASTSAQCEFTATGYSAADCGGNELATWTEGDAACSIGPFASVGLQADVTGSCDVATAPSPAGVVAPAGPVTLCCL